MEDYRKTLSAVGTALIVVGAVDIAFMIYWVAGGRSYASSLNIFALVAGLLLRRGSLPTAQVVAFFSAFYLGALLGMSLLVLAGIPLGLLGACFRLHPVGVVGSLLLYLVLLGLMAWVYSGLTSPAVLAAIREKRAELGSFIRKPQRGFLVGALLIAILLVAGGWASWSGIAARAKVEARRRLGGQYQFVVTSFDWQGWNGRATVRAHVIAYNQKEIKLVDVAWEQ